MKHWRQERWRKYKTLTLQHFIRYRARGVTVGTFGGRTDRREKPTGFFHVKKLRYGWTLVDPEGCHFYCVGVNSTSPHDTQASTREAFRRTFGSRRNWAVETHALLRDELRFNSLACWSNWKEFRDAGIRIPYMRRWNMMARYAKKRGNTHPEYGHMGFANDVIPVFDEEFPAFCNALASGMSATKDDPWLIGHFSDNELPLKQDGIVSRYLKNPANDAGRAKALAWLRERRKTPDRITEADDQAFAELVIGTYFRIVSAAIKRHDPNHLFLGSRFHGGVSKQDATYRACGPYVDVVTVNYYHRWSPEQDVIDRWAKLSGKPIMITEWYAKGEDSGLDNSDGAGFTVRTQRDRGRFYENYTLGLLRNGNIVGWNWFRYIDDGPSEDGGASNKGILDLDYRPYRELADSIIRINRGVYCLHDYMLVARSPHLLDKPETVGGRR